MARRTEGADLAPGTSNESGELSTEQKSPSQPLGVRKAAKITFSLTQTCELSLSGLLTLRVILFRTTEKYMSLRELDGRDRSRR